MKQPAANLIDNPRPKRILKFDYNSDSHLYRDLSDKHLKLIKKKDKYCSDIPLLRIDNNLNRFAGIRRRNQMKEVKRIKDHLGEHLKNLFRAINGKYRIWRAKQELKEAEK
jgi:hypothetical protein